MKRRIGVAVFVFALASGCRTLVGIDDLQLEQQQHPQSDGGNPQQNPGTDAASRTDAGEFRPTPEQQDTINACLSEAGAGCRPCCKQAFKSFIPALERTSQGASCVCATCARECNDAGACDPALGQTAAAQPSGPNACVQCEDGLFAGQTTPPEGACADFCGSDVDCQAGLACLRQCP